MNMRSKLVDEPIVKMLLTKKYAKSNLKFTDSNSKNEFYLNGFKRYLTTIRNSSKYFKSRNFVVSVDKNNLKDFSNSMFVFIDEIANSLYITDGITLLHYIIEHSKDINYIGDSNKSYLLIRKNDIVDLVKESASGIIEYNKAIAHLFEIGRDEDQYKIGA